MDLKYISFDLQGTLTDLDFSKQYWNQVLPQLCGVNDCKADSVYDPRYYSHDYWFKRYNIACSFFDSIKQCTLKPHFFMDMFSLLQWLHQQNKYELIITSATTKDFIRLELGENHAKNFFSDCFSSLDDFGIAGKTPLFYHRLLSRLNIKPKEMLHIGDDPLMDIENANQVGINTFFFDPKRSRQENGKNLRAFLSMPGDIK